MLLLRLALELVPLGVNFGMLKGAGLPTTSAGRAWLSVGSVLRRRLPPSGSVGTVESCDCRAVEHVRVC
jgi:hypothetical protein